MVNIGYPLLCEQAPPKQLVESAVRAERAGFDFAVISDHYPVVMAQKAATMGRLSVSGRYVDVVGAKGQDRFLDWAEKTLPPRLRRNGWRA